ncbi:MAG: hypothetical protein K6B64_04210 [Acholeplasmatales bacterium]|nr:hypothetical protein [Acholeplasmatales bacterium]
MPKNNDDFQHVMPVRNLPGMLRGRISEANNEALKPSMEEGKEQKIDLSKFPKVFFEKEMTLEEKINYVLKEKETDIDSLANDIKVDKSKLLKYIKKGKLPKDILKALSDYSSYPLEFFKLKSFMELMK